MNIKDIKLKVCGMREQLNIEQLVQLQPDFIGFIFYDKSKRFAGDLLTEKTIASVPKGINKTGVFVNESQSKVLEIVKKYDLQYVQLHGDESAAYCKELAEAGCKIIKAFSVDDTFDFTMTEAYEPWCSFFLFDTKGKEYGGNGTTFNWQVLENYSNNKPFFLSGGLDLSNVDLINQLKHLNLYALDVNSKFESAPGLKNISDLKSLVKKLYGRVITE